MTPDPCSLSPVSSLHPLLNRRRFFADTGIGLGAIALTSLLGRQGLLAANLAGKESIRPLIHPGSPYAPREPHFTPKAKNVLLIFCSGACSQLDTFDYKPELIRRHGRANCDIVRDDPSHTPLQSGRATQSRDI